MEKEILLWFLKNLNLVGILLIVCLCLFAGNEATLLVKLHLDIQNIECLTCHLVCLCLQVDCKQFNALLDVLKTWGHQSGVLFIFAVFSIVGALTWWCIALSTWLGDFVSRCRCKLILQNRGAVLDALRELSECRGILCAEQFQTGHHWVTVAVLIHDFRQFVPKGRRVARIIFRRRFVACDLFNGTHLHN